jgi:hypothetical protein
LRSFLRCDWQGAHVKSPFEKPLRLVTGVSHLEK